MNPQNTSQPFDRTDTSIVNVLYMLRPILHELELIGRTIPATELAKICRQHKKRLPLRNYNGLQMADQIAFAAKHGGITVDDIDVRTYMEIDPVTHRRSPRIGFERAWLDDAQPIATKDNTNRDFGDLSLMEREKLQREALERLAESQKGQLVTDEVYYEDVELMNHLRSLMHKHPKETGNLTTKVMDNGIKDKADSPLL